MANDEMNTVPEATGLVYDGRTLRDFQVSVSRGDDRILLRFYDRQDPKVKPAAVSLGPDEAKRLAQDILERVGEQTAS